ncbi:unnamed protein product, partial [Ectocarpus sp. 13 AM-2016]
SVESTPSSSSPSLVRRGRPPSTQGNERAVRRGRKKLNTSRDHTDRRQLKWSGGPPNRDADRGRWGNMRYISKGTRSYLHSLSPMSYPQKHVAKIGVTPTRGAETPR